MIPGMRTSVKKFVPPTSPVRNVRRPISDTATAGSTSGAVVQGGSGTEYVSSMTSVKKPRQTTKTAAEIIEDIDKLASQLSDKNKKVLYNVIDKILYTQD